ncbi:MAG: hypothetical protein PWQ95_470 [Thermococcaceae archaeon]|nr:hypothetical protein [Thermococcaceae archaeon]
MEEIESLRSPQSPLILASIRDMIEVARSTEVVLAGGWAVYHWLKKWGLRGIPSVDVDFLVGKEHFEAVERKLRELGYESSAFRYSKTVRDKDLPFLEERLNVDLLFDEKPSQLSFESPYVAKILKEKYYSTEHFEFEGMSGEVRVVLPEALIVLKLDIYSNPAYPDEKREKHWKDMVDIYSLIMGAEEIELKILGELQGVKPFSFEHLRSFFSNESRELEEVANVVMQYVGLPFDREGLLLRLDEIETRLEVS